MSPKGPTRVPLCQKEAGPVRSRRCVDIGSCPEPEDHRCRFSFRCNLNRHKSFAGIAGCRNSRNLYFSLPVAAQAFHAIDTQLGARHRRRPTTIHRGCAQRTRTISAGNRFGQGCPNRCNKSDRKENPRQPQLCSMPGRHFMSCLEVKVAHRP